MMAGLNTRGPRSGGDLAIDFEVTSNRPDCLSHIGIAREVAVLWGRELKLPTGGWTEKNAGRKPAEGADQLCNLC